MDLHFAFRSIFGAGDFELVSGDVAIVCLREYEGTTNAHLVGGEGAGFVRADDTSATEGLHRGQGAHYGILRRHTTRAQG